MWNFVKRWFSFVFGRPYKSGEITVCPGCPEEILIKTGWTPKKVFLAFSDHLLPTVCGGDVDCFDVTIVPHGFIIVARVKSQTRVIEWIASKR